MSEVNKIQVGGTHYSRAGNLQHWDYVLDLLDNRYLEGCITKYVFRHRFKNGLVDLKKALHFCDKLIESHRNGLVSTSMRRPGVVAHELFRYAKANSLSITEMQVAVIAASWQGETDLDQLRSLILELIEGQEAADLALEAAKAGAEPTGAYVAQ